MERPHFVAVGGTQDQPIRCLYAGADGATAEEVFQAAADDGNNELVRLYVFPDYVRIATPKRYDVPPAAPSDLDEVEPCGPTRADMEAAIARIEELGGHLSAARAKAEECERSHAAALGRIADLEKALAKAKKAAAAPAAE